MHACVFVCRGTGAVVSVVSGDTFQELVLSFRHVSPMLEPCTAWVLKAGLVNHGRRRLYREAVGRLETAGEKAMVDVFHTQTGEGFASPSGWGTGSWTWLCPCQQRTLLNFIHFSVLCSPQSPGANTGPQAGQRAPSVLVPPTGTLPFFFFFFKQILKLSHSYFSEPHSGLL